ncbi:MAG: NfeD family protein, partial [Planctomycetota bacterium]
SAQSLLGAEGIAETQLRPAGKARFGDERRDVVCEKGFIAPGARVKVVAVRGNAVVVRAMDAAP